MPVHGLALTPGATVFDRLGAGAGPASWLLAYNDTAVILGDSNAQHGILATSAAATSVQAYWRQEDVCLRSRYPVLNTDSWAITTGTTPWVDGSCQGVSGETTGGIFVRVPHVIAMAPKLIKYLGGYNNRTTAMAAAGQPSGSEGIPDTFNALRAGLPTAVIVIATVTATDGASVTLNNAIRTYVAGLRTGGDLRVFCWDRSKQVGTTTAGNTAGTWAQTPPISPDTTHLGLHGGLKACFGEDGLETGDSYANFLRSNGIIDLSGGNQFEDLWASNGGGVTNNYMNDPLFTGATSGAGGTGWTGIRPNGWSVVRGGTTPAMTMVSSIEADPDPMNPGGNRWKLVFTAVNPGGGVGGAGGTGSNFENWQLQSAKAAPGIDNDWFKAGFKISYDGKNWAKATSLKCTDKANAGRTSSCIADANNATAQQMLSVAQAFTPMTAPHVGSVTPGNLTTTITLTLASSLAPDGDTTTIYISRPCAKQIADPRPAFNL